MGWESLQVTTSHVPPYELGGSNVASAITVHTFELHLSHPKRGYTPAAILYANALRGNSFY